MSGTKIKRKSRHSVKINKRSVEKLLSLLSSKRTRQELSPKAFYSLLMSLLKQRWTQMEKVVKALISHPKQDGGGMNRVGGVYNRKETGFTVTN